MKLTNEQMTSDLTELIGNPFEMVSVNQCNWKVKGQPGHPFVIGPKHVAHASDHHYGRLGEETMKVIPCAEQSCRRPLCEHTHDTVLFVKLIRDCSNEEARAGLITGTDYMKEHGIDGVAFIESGFRIAAPEASFPFDSK